jgi:2,3-bisphosphoglycerate-dependent phosphoglycerate mutase
MTGKLILIRHQESEWNKLSKWTGKTDVHLSEQGYKDSEQMGFLIRDLKIDKAYVSGLVRTIETLNCFKKNCKLDDVPVEKHHELDERDYGDYTGLNKWEFKEKFGAPLIKSGAPSRGERICKYNRLLEIENS